MSAALPILDDDGPAFGDCSEPLVVGLLNSMPDAEFRATERQFASLVAEAAPPGWDVRLRLLTLADVPRSAAGRADVQARYEVFDERGTGRLDGLIVSGTEPRALSLTAEPYWPALARLVDWAERHTASTVWSCLAAHAAVLHLDGIERQPMPHKLSGVFECAKSDEHPATATLPGRWTVPHSRHNGLPEAGLRAAGYAVLSGSAATGPDLFARQGRSLFLFTQGHPEYDPGSLLREYRRDVARFLSGRRDRYPDPLRGCLAPQLAARLAEFQLQATRDRRPELMQGFPIAVDAVLAPSWREPARLLYGGWLRTLVARRQGRRPVAATR